jgi:hydroxyacylglutathione hydrolase
MYIEQMYTNCLAEAAYYIESGGEAAIIDPIREILPYIQKARERGVKIKYVFETHFHADFVSGHIDLARESGARIVFGPGADTSYDVYNAADGELITIGKIRIKVLHTPGHTPESTSYLLQDEQGKDYCIFTGDTLFVGDVGRPDLLDGKMTKEALAGMMYDSLQIKIKPLADEVIVYPAHGPGSACGKNIGKETWSTIGQQKKTNYALADMPRKEFIGILTEGLSAPPAYFFKDAQINKEGYENIETVMHKNMRALNGTEFRSEQKADVLILDTRDPEAFENGFIPGSINIGLQGTFAVWVGTIIDIQTSLLLVTESGKEEESIRRLARVGYEKVLGYLKGGIASWTSSGETLDRIQSVTAEEFCSLQDSSEVIDVRKEGEYDNLHVKGARLIPLSELQAQLGVFDPKKQYLVHCAGGYRSMIASSILKKNGIHNFKNVLGGMAKIKEAGAAVEKLKSVNE